MSSADPHVSFTLNVTVGLLGCKWTLNLWTPEQKRHTFEEKIINTFYYLQACSHEWQ